MPKSGATNIVEQHLEKLVLGICVVALAALWLTSSPREVALPGAISGRSVRLSRLDQIVLDVARDVQRQVEEKGAAPPTEGGVVSPTRDYVAEIRALQSGAGVGPGGMAAFGQFAMSISTPTVPEVAKVSLTDLIEAMPAPGKPVARAVRDLPNRAMETPADVLAAHVVAVYPWGQLVSAWKENLGRSGMPCWVAAVGVVAQVREKLPDGSWSQPREVHAVVVTADGQGGMTNTVEAPEIPPYDGTNLADISQLRALIAEPNTGWQSYILQPSYWQIWWPGYGWVNWLVNLPENQVTKEAAERPAQPTEGAIAGTPGATPGLVRPMPISPRVTRPMARGVPYGTETEYGDYEVSDTGETPSRGRYGQPPTPSTPGPAAPAAPAAPVLEEVPAPQQPVVPDIQQQMQNGKVLVWFHDDSLQSLKVYQYRLAVKFLNPLLGFDNVVKDPAFAAVPSITTQFSEWSDEVEVPQPTEFFLTGAMESQGKVTVTVFTRSTGQQVKKQFTLVPGQAIGEIKEIQLTNPADGAVAKVPVSFATGAIAVELNFDRLDPLGRKTVEMLYLDEKGNLRTKVDVNSLSRTDKEYLRFRDLDAKEKITRLAAEVAKASGQVTPPSPGGL